VSFLVGTALAIGLLVVLPLVAHFLRRGRAAELPFPPAALVQATQTSARRERRLEDRALFGLRAASVLALALLGATPLVRCSRLALARGSGGSLAVAIVLDDSLSMRAVQSGKGSRFERARDAAQKLLESAREGDSVAIVLAGTPARVALAATTDLALARRTLGELTPSDRATDLAPAVALARASFGSNADRQRRLVVLSDFAATPPGAGEPAPWVPLPDLATPAPDCGLTSAEVHGKNVAVTVACSSAEAARGRAVELSGGGKASAALEPRAGVQALTLSAGAAEVSGLGVKLTGADAIVEDDAAPVSPDTLGLRVSVLADDTESGAATGGAPLIEQALEALERGVSLRPLTVVPDQAADLERDALLLLDDPAGLGPEARAALAAFTERGGMAVALLGPRAEARRIGATLEPFVQGPARWETTTAAHGVDAASLGWLGTEAQSLVDVKPHGRTWLDVGHAAGSRITGTWSDGAPFIVERELGRGLIVTVTLPSSLTVSDFALRPGFVALLDHWLGSARRRRGLGQSVVGTTWSFGTARPTVLGPGGPVPLIEAFDRGRTATPALHGTYRVTTEHGEERRTVTLDPQEITTLPVPPAPGAGAPAGVTSAPLTDASSEVAWAVLAILGLELVLRLRRVDARPGFR
jgi:hypothetical protein